MKNILSAALGLSMVAGILACPAPAQAFYLKNYYTRKCLAIASTTAGTQFIQWDCKDTPSQQFSKVAGTAHSSASDVRPGQGPVRLYNGVDSSNYAVVDIASSPAYNGDKVVLAFSSDPLDSSLIWYPTAGHSAFNYGVQCYRFENGTSAHQVMGVSGGSRKDGAPIITWNDFENSGNPNAWLDHLDQFWCPVDNW